MKIAAIIARILLGGMFVFASITYFFSGANAVTTACA